MQYSIGSVYRLSDAAFNRWMKGAASGVYGINHSIAKKVGVQSWKVQELDGLGRVTKIVIVHDDTAVTTHDIKDNDGHDAQCLFNQTELKDGTVLLMKAVESTDRYMIIEHREVFESPAVVERGKQKFFTLEEAKKFIIELHTEFPGHRNHFELFKTIGHAKVKVTTTVEVM